MLRPVEVDDAGTLTAEVHIAAPPEFVFDYLVEPDKMLRWIGIAASLDPRPGGLFQLSVQPTAVVVGEYLEVDRPRRVVFTWGWDMEGALIGPGSTTVEIDLVPDGDATRLRLTHRGIPSQMHAFVGDGWTHFLARLAIAGAGEDAGPDAWSGRT